MRELIIASVKMHGSSNNGHGAVLPRDVHDVIERRPYIVELGDQESIPALAGRLAAANADMRKPSEQLKAQISEENPEIQFTGVWGFNGMGVLAERVLADALLKPDFVADLAISEIDATWVMNAEPEDITSHAMSILGARAIAGHFHSLNHWCLESGD